MNGEREAKDIQRISKTSMNLIQWVFFGVVCCSKEEEEGERKIWNYVLSWCSGEVLSKKAKEKKTWLCTNTSKRASRDSRDVDGLYIPALELWCKEILFHLTGTVRSERVEDNKSKPDWPLFLRVTTQTQLQLLSWHAIVTGSCAMA